MFEWCKMVEGKPSHTPITCSGIYKLLDCVPQGEKKSSNPPKARLSTKMSGSKQCLAQGQSSFMDRADLRHLLMKKCGICCHFLNYKV